MAAGNCRSTWLSEQEIAWPFFSCDLRIRGNPWTRAAHAVRSIAELGVVACRAESPESVRWRPGAALACDRAYTDTRYSVGKKGRLIRSHFTEEEQIRARPSKRPRRNGGLRFKDTLVEQRASLECTGAPRSSRIVPCGLFGSLVAARVASLLLLSMP